MNEKKEGKEKKKEGKEKKERREEEKKVLISPGNIEPNPRHQISVTQLEVRQQPTKQYPYSYHYFYIVNRTIRTQGSA